MQGQREDSGYLFSYISIDQPSLERIVGKEDPPPLPSGPGEDFDSPKAGKKRAKSDFRGIQFSKQTHRSSIDPEALL
jgi:hypothetical protein